MSPNTDASRVFIIFFAMYGIIILGIFLGIAGEFILKRNDENMKRRLANVRVKVMEQFGEDDSSITPEDRSLAKEFFAIMLAEAPVVLILAVLGAPIVYLEGWGVVKG